MVASVTTGSYPPGIPREFQMVAVNAGTCVAAQLILRCQKANSRHPKCAALSVQTMWKRTKLLRVLNARRQLTGTALVCPWMS